MNKCGPVLSLLVITLIGITVSTFAAKDLRQDFSQESNLTLLETAARGVTISEADSFLGPDDDAGEDAAVPMQDDIVAAYNVDTDTLLRLPNVTSVYLAQDVAKVMVTNNITGGATQPAFSTSIPAFNDSHFFSAEDLQWTVDQYSAKVNLSDKDSVSHYWKLSTSGTTTVRPLVNQTQLPKVDKKTLGAKWAACFHAVNVTKPAINFTCNTFLLMHYSFMQFWTKHSAVQMCEHREAYGELMECVLDASKGCLPPANLRHVPDNGKARIGLNYICDVGMAERFKVNITCAQSHFREVFECIYRDVQLVTGRDSLPVPIWPSLMCRTYDIADLCSWENLQVCGRQTAAAYTRLMSLYLRPPSCSSSASRPEVRHSAALLIAVALVLIRILSWAYSYR